MAFSIKNWSTRVGVSGFVVSLFFACHGSTVRSLAADEFDLRGGGTAWCINGSTPCAGATGCKLNANATSCTECRSSGNYSSCAQKGTNTACSGTYQNDNQQFCGVTYTGGLNDDGFCNNANTCTTKGAACGEKIFNTVTGQNCN